MNKVYLTDRLTLLDRYLNFFYFRCRTLFGCKHQPQCEPSCFDSQQQQLRALERAMRQVYSASPESSFIASVDELPDGRRFRAPCTPSGRPHSRGSRSPSPSGSPSPSSDRSSSSPPAAASGGGSGGTGTGGSDSTQAVGASAGSVVFETSPANGGDGTAGEGSSADPDGVSSSDVVEDALSSIDLGSGGIGEIDASAASILQRVFGGVSLTSDGGGLSNNHDGRRMPGGLFSRSNAKRKVRPMLRC